MLDGVKLRAVGDIIDDVYPAVLEEGVDLLASMDSRVVKEECNILGLIIRD